MKLNYTKILLFFFPLNILVTSYHAHNNKNKPSITPRHTQRYTSRILSECGIQSSIYDNDAEMKSVKENFDRQTSQRFDEYEERMKVKREKRKEERDKNIQEIIEKDRMDKSLAEKVEKGCLRCGCGLGGVAASIGLFGGLGTYGWKTAATATAMELAKEAAEKAGAAAAAEAGKNAVIAGLEELDVSTLNGQTLVSYFATMDYTNAINIARVINIEYEPSSCIIGRGVSGAEKPFCSWVMRNFVSQGNGASTYKSIEIGVTSIVSNAQTPAAEAAKKATDEVIQRSIAVVDSKYAICQTAIIASVVALLIIVLVMIIIYLVLRYRRKKKMNKKQQYTKLLDQ
ncbi:PIR protein, putative [Plasmodium sp. gorilla clade G1]|nr:PIR protein, putative [Plasmodium sp. gorilla clade G1]